MVLPQTAQNARLEYPDDRQVEGAPPGPAHATCSLANSTHMSVSVPEWR
jgi:hypothetical protein